MIPDYLKQKSNPVPLLQMILSVFRWFVPRLWCYLQCYLTVMCHVSFCSPYVESCWTHTCTRLHVSLLRVFTLVASVWWSSQSSVGVVFLGGVGGSRRWACFSFLSSGFFVCCAVFKTYGSFYIRHGNKRNCKKTPGICFLLLVNLLYMIMKKKVNTVSCLWYSNSNSDIFHPSATFKSHRLQR